MQRGSEQHLLSPRSDAVHPAPAVGHRRARLGCAAFKLVADAWPRAFCAEGRAPWRFAALHAHPDPAALRPDLVAPRSESAAPRPHPDLATPRPHPDLAALRPGLVAPRSESAAPPKRTRLASWLAMCVFVLLVLSWFSCAPLAFAEEEGGSAASATVAAGSDGNPGTDHDAGSDSNPDADPDADPDARSDSDTAAESDPDAAGSESDPDSAADAEAAAAESSSVAAAAGGAAAESAAKTAASTMGAVSRSEGGEDRASVADDPANVVNPRQTPDNSFLYDTSIEELVMADSSHQGKTVQVTGEVVGDVIAAEEDGGKHWITLETLEAGSDDSISVLIDDSYLSMVESLGEYGRTGTTLQVIGTFYLTCPSHEGIMDIHAETVKQVDQGSEYEQPVNESTLFVGVALVIVGLVLTVVYSRLRERQL